MKSFDMGITAERLRALRAEKNVGQNQVAKDIKVSNASISYWENARQEPTAAALFKLAEYYEVSVDYLLGLTDD